MTMSGASSTPAKCVDATGRPAHGDAASRVASDDTSRLLEFLRGRDMSCPACRYNLRDLTQPICPECRQRLSLTVGVRDLRIGFLLVTLAPGIFSGIAAVLLSIPLLLATILGAGPVPGLLVAIDLFGWCSGIAALVLVRRRYAFLRRDHGIQLTWAVATWAVHLLVFAIAVVTAMA